MTATGVSLETIEKVMSAIEKEADLDGLSTASSYYLAPILNMHRASVSAAIKKLIDTGRLKQVGTMGRGGGMVLQIVGMD